MTQLDRVREVVDRLFCEQSIVSRLDRSTHSFRNTTITSGEGRALARWVVSENASRTLEIGLGFGMSALHICEGLLERSESGARHVAIDPFQTTGFANCGLQALEDAGLSSMVELHLEGSQTALPHFLKEGRHFDFAFVDGNHRFDYVFIDLFYVGQILKKGGVVILDDYNLPGIEKAAAFFVNNLSWKIEELSPSDDAHRWVVLRTTQNPDQRDFRYFVDF